MKQSHFEYFQGRGRQWFFRLVARNGKTVCQSEGYVSKGNCLRGIATMRAAAVNAPAVEA